MDQIIQLPLTALRESPFNPRKTFGEAALAELAQSIREQGILQPVVVRPIVEVMLDPTAVPRYEIVFGHRRTRAAALAGLEELPCLMRHMDDQQAAIAQVHENLQRADVSMLEEAESFAHLRTAHGMTADAIASAVSKSRSYVFGRLKLMTADTAVLEAVRDEGLPPDTALELARLPTHAVQRSTLKTLRLAPGLWPSVRDCQRSVRALYTRHIDVAPFDAADATLHPPAGACTTCPKRAGNDPAMEGLDADICTDGECYTTKADVHLQRQVAQLRAQGYAVILGEEAHAILPFSANWTKGPWTVATDVELDREIDTDECLRMLAKAGVQTPLPAHVLYAQTQKLVPVYRDADLEKLEDIWRTFAKKVLGDDGSATDEAGGTHYNDPDSPNPTRRATDVSDWLLAERAFLDYHAAEAIRTAVLKAARARARTTDDLRLMVLREFDLAGSLDSEAAKELGVDTEALEAAEHALEHPRNVLEAKLCRMSADDLAYLMLAQSLQDTVSHVTVYGRESAARAAAIAQHYGIDAAAIAAQLVELRAQQAAGAQDAAATRATQQEEAHV